MVGGVLSLRGGEERMTYLWTFGKLVVESVTFIDQNPYKVKLLRHGKSLQPISTLHMTKYGLTSNQIITHTLLLWFHFFCKLNPYTWGLAWLVEGIPLGIEVPGSNLGRDDSN